MYYVNCPRCGLSNGNNDKIISTLLIHNDYNGAKIIETKQCNVCGKIYKIEKQYNFAYEEIIY